jgi:hypothetical protein
VALLQSLLSLAVVAGAAGKPTAFPPEFDLDAAVYTVAVVDVRESGGLPEIEECKGRNVICMHSPSWLRGKVLTVLAGAPLPSEFHAATSGHYGPVTPTEDADQPTLMLLAASGKDLVMIRYAEALLYTDGRGELHMPVDSPQVAWWLPCSVTSLPVAVNDRTLSRAMARPIDEASGSIRDDRFHRVQGRAYWPRMTIPMTRLREHLANARDMRPDFACPAEGEAWDGYSFFSIYAFESEDEDTDE